MFLCTLSRGSVESVGLKEMNAKALFKSLLEFYVLSTCFNFTTVGPTISSSLYIKLQQL